MRKILGFLCCVTLFLDLFSCSPSTYKKINHLQDVMFGHEGKV